MSDGPLPTHRYIDPEKTAHQAAIQALEFERTEALIERRRTEGEVQAYTMKELDQIKETIDLLCELRDGDKLVIDKPKDPELICRFCEHVVTQQPNGVWVTIDTDAICVETESDVHVPEEPDAEHCDGCGVAFGEYDGRYHKHCG